MNVTLFSAHDPAAVGLLFGTGHRAEAFDLRTALARTCGIGHGHTGRVDIASVRFKHDAAHIIKLGQRMKFQRAFVTDLVKAKPVKPGLCLLQAQLMLALFALRQIEGSRLENTAALSGFFFQLLVKSHRIMLYAGCVVVVMQAVDIGCRMPGGPAGQLITFQKDDVRPAKLGKMIENRTAGQPAADDHRLRMRLHTRSPLAVRLRPIPPLH